MTYKITKKEWYFVFLIMGMGFIFSMRKWILFLDKLNPLHGLMVYYAVLYLFILLISKTGLVIASTKIDNPIKIFGIILITFALFITINWESPYINIMVNGQFPDGISQIYFHSEDGATYFFWNNIMGIHDIEQLRLLVFVVSPAILSLIGIFLLHKVQIFNM